MQKYSLDETLKKMPVQKYEWRDVANIGQWAKIKKFLGGI